MRIPLDPTTSAEPEYREFTCARSRHVSWFATSSALRCPSWISCQAPLSDILLAVMSFDMSESQVRRSSLELGTYKLLEILVNI